MPSFIETISDLSPSMRGFTVSLIMLCGAIPAMIAGYLADRFGRLRVIIAGATLCTIGCVLECATFSLALFLVGRALMGIGQGFALTNVGVYICEIAPSRSRGRFVSLPSFGAAIGVCIGYFSCYGSIHIDGSMSWRLPYILQATLSSIWAVGSLFLPESPRWLILHGKRDQAMKALEVLDFEKAEAEKDVLRPIEIASSEVGVLEGIHLIFTKEYQMQTFLAVFILSFIQLSGIDGVIYVCYTMLETEQIFTDNTTVCSYNFCPGRDTFPDCIVSCLGRICDSNARFQYTRNASCGQVGSSYVCYIRWDSIIRNHAIDWLFVRCGCSALIWSGQVGRHHISICVCHRIHLHVGCLWENIRV